MSRPRKEDTRGKNDPIRLAKTSAVQMIKEAKANCRVVREKWLKVAQEGDAYFAGHQWTAEELQYLNSKQRATFTFNYVLRAVLGVLGLEIANRNQPLVQPRIPSIPGENALATLDNDILKWVWDQTEGDEQITQAFFDNLRRGMGWIEAYMDYSENPEGVVRFHRIDGLSMYWDVSADEPNLANSYWRMRGLWMPYRQVALLWGADVADSLHAALARDGSADPEVVRNVSPIGYMPGSEVSAPKTPHYGDVFVDQMQFWDYEEMYQTIDPQADPNDPNAELVLVDKKQKPIIEKVAAANGRPNPVFTRFNKKVFKQVFAAGDYEIETVDIPTGDFTFQCMTGIRDDKEHYYFGLVEPLKSPANFKNKMLSAALEQYAKGLKHPLLVKTGAVSNPRAFEDKIASANPIVVADAIDEGNIRQLQSSDMPAGLVWLYNAAATAINEVVALPPELFGASSSRDEGATLDRQRQVQTIAILSPFFNSERTMRIRLARNCLEFTRQFTTDGRLVHLTNDATKQAIPLFREKLISDYYIVLDQSNRSPHQKEAVWNNSQPLIQLLFRQGMYDILADFIQAYGIYPIEVNEKLAARLRQLQQKIEQGQPATGAQMSRKSPQLEAAKAQHLAAQAKLAEIKGQAMIEANRLKAAALGAEMAQHAADHKQRAREHVAEMHRHAREHGRNVHNDTIKGIADIGKMLGGLQEENATKEEEPAAA